MKVDKNYLLNQSKVFCMFPWVHLNVTPYGNVYPCCSSDYTDPFDNVRDKSLKTIFNNDKMRNLRLNMLNDKQTDICNYCYKHEKSSPFSFRKYSIEKFSNYFDETIPNTNTDGTLDEFKMRYYDVRFSNICNFKCRTCGKEFSSQWAQELNEQGKNEDGQIIYHADKSNNLLEEIKEQVFHIDFAYFVGGEPLITDEHYIILEKMISVNRAKDITLRYNTNMSNFKFKKYNIFDLWKHFKKVELSASLDHYGEKAEYIRHGTRWGIVEENLKLVRDVEFIDYQFNTVLSVFNYVTLKDFFNYMIEKDLLRQKDYISIYRALTPTYFCSQALPLPVKKIGNQHTNALYKHLKSENYYQAIHVKDAISFTNESNSWEVQKQDFQNNILSVDKIRNENFSKIFPELKSLLE